MSRLGQLKSITTLKGLAKLLGFKPSGLSYILFKQPVAAKYKIFQIPKRTGGTRTIQAPEDALKLLQRKLSDLLQDCLDEINAAKNKKDLIAHGFKRRRSIVSNARRHRNRRYVFNVDLETFFPSINFGRVRGFLIKDRNFALHPSLATLIAQIACYNNALPQGSPCSPVISNLIGHLLDMHLVRLAARVGCTYSRYADDLTFSTNKKTFPAEVAVNSGTNSHLWSPGSSLQRLVTRSGFTINASKTRMQYRTSRQDVTGLVVNKKINIRSEYRRAVRAMVHNLLTNGSFELYVYDRNTTPPSLTKRPGTINQLHGMLGFIDGIDLYNKREVEAAKGPVPLTKKELMYQRFLIYTNFYAAARPVIVCEGETDNVYLTHAIRSLAGQFPELAEINDAKIRLKVRLFKYPRTSTARILRLNDGGSGTLAQFIATYKKETDRFKAPGGAHPFIILYDNDSGADSIRNAIKQITKKPISSTGTFVHVIRNLYAVPTPITGGATESKIEDFFDANIKATQINGKQFDEKNNFETTTHYGKKIFAHRVVRPNADTINFAGFHPLLTNLVAVITSHSATISNTSPPQTPQTPHAQTPQGQTPQPTATP